MPSDAPSSSSSSSSSSPRQLYLFGTPIASSLSPTFHNACFAARSVPWHLQRLDSALMSDFLPLLASPSFGGAAVTMPHKTTILSHAPLARIADSARLIGAANTLYLDPAAPAGTPSLVATNTDVAGIRDSILAAVPALQTPEPNRTGVVVGGGATTRTAVYTLLATLGCERVFLINRDDAEVEAVVSHFAEQGMTGVEMLRTPDEARARLGEAGRPRVVVNAVPSYEPKTDEERRARETVKCVLGLPPHPAGDARECVFLEMCYAPLPWTPICDVAKEQGWVVVQGMECMYHQAVAQQLLWLGEPEGSVDLLAVGRKAALDELVRRKVEGGEPR